MSSAVIASLVNAYQQVIIYMGIPILSIGLIGGLFNVLVFLSLRTFRESSCAFYFTIMSMVNTGQLLIGLGSRILISGFNIDFTRSSLFYCKFRTFFFQVMAFCSLMCISLATMDQYFATCTRPHWQVWSNIRVARRIVISVIIMIIIEQIPCVIYYDHRISLPSNETICIITNTNFEKFNVYGNYLILGNLIPHTLTFSFGILAYRNIQQLSYRTVPLVRRELDKQLSTMVLVQISYICLTITPNLIIYIVATYGNIQDSTVRSQINLAYAITLCLYYSFFASPFYIYILVSERFRRQFFYVIFQMHINRWCPHRVAPRVPTIST
ncbi:hypothetical protein I4U23_022546 [Adineta vaga]|nr:hypothetical protein I4U23_022546 [Adineta vaga]